jgi:hypothetical protein
MDVHSEQSPSVGGIRVPVTKQYPDHSILALELAGTVAQENPFGHLEGAVRAILLSVHPHPLQIDEPELVGGSMHQGSGIQARSLALVLDLSPGKAILVQSRLRPTFLPASRADQQQTHRHETDHVPSSKLQYVHLNPPRLQNVNGPCGQSHVRPYWKQPPRDIPEPLIHVQSGNKTFFTQILKRIKGMQLCHHPAFAKESFSP